MKRPIIPKAFRHIIIAICACLLVILILIAILVNICTLQMPGQETSTYIIRKSISSIYLKNKTIAINTPNGQTLLRLVATNTDTLLINNGYTYVNSALTNEAYDVSSSFIVSKDITHKTLHSIQRLNDKAQIFDTISLPINQIKDDWKIYLRAPIPKNIPDTRIYPHNDKINWNAYNLGPIRIPSKGETILLDEKNMAIYAPLIKAYEDAEPHPNTSYTFKHNYVWAMCDNRDICSDSRIFGPLPADNIIGIIQMKLW